MYKTIEQEEVEIDSGVSVDLISSPKVAIMEGEGVGACYLARSTLRVEGRAGAPGWD
jgi:hypothetical protein